jgi:hypothetical protein
MDVDGLKNEMHLQKKKAFEKKGYGGEGGGSRRGDLYLLPLTRPFCFSTTSHWLAVSGAYTKDNKSSQPRICHEMKQDR